MKSARGATLSTRNKHPQNKQKAMAMNTADKMTFVSMTVRHTMPTPLEWNHKKFE
jgi:hypothetical protein